MPAGGITPALNTDRHDIRLNLLSRNDDGKMLAAFALLHTSDLAEERPLHNIM